MRQESSDGVKEARGGCECAACKVVPHASDCAVHNEPAMPAGPCDCGAWVRRARELVLALLDADRASERSVAKGGPELDEPFAVAFDALDDHLKARAADGVEADAVVIPVVRGRLGETLRQAEVGEDCNCAKERAKCTGRCTRPAGVQTPETKSTREQWRPIETAPRDKHAWFWIRPKNDDETYHNTSGIAIKSNGEPHAEYTKFGRWSSLWTATHWMPNDPPAAPKDGVKGTPE